jgi:hypothetical protein
MKFAMPLYEFKNQEMDDWIQISDIDLMNRLYRTYKKISPVIKEMIGGKVIKTPYGIFRLKMRGGELTDRSAA